MIDYSDVSLSKSKNRVCEVIDCFEVATEVVDVSAGKFGTINLNLCHRCTVTKFQTSAKRKCIDESDLTDSKVCGHMEITE